MPTSVQMQRQWLVRPVAIATGTSLSGRIAIRGDALLGIVLPAAWTAASLTFLGAGEASTQAGVAGQDSAMAAATWSVFTDQGATGTEVALTDTFIQARLGDLVVMGGILDALAVLPYVIFRSGTKATPVNQGAARLLYLITKA